MGYRNEGRGDRKGDYPRRIFLPLVGVGLTALVIANIFPPVASALPPATALAIQKVTTTLRAETNRELARRRRNRTDDDGLNELCNEAVKQAVETIVDRTIQRVLADNMADRGEEIRPLPIEQVRESMAKHNCAREYVVPKHW